MMTTRVSCCSNGLPKRLFTFFPESQMELLIFFTLTFIVHAMYVRTGKSLSEALIFASTNPQYDNRLFIEL